MKHATMTVLTAFAICSLAADVMITEVPADPSLIRVEGGKTTIVGTEALKHLKLQWSFEDAADLRKATIGDISFQMLRNSGSNVETSTNDVKRGQGAMYLKGNFGMYIQNASIPSFITPTCTKPFTVSFWFKGGAGGAKASRIFYLGPYQYPAAGTFLDFLYQNDERLDRFYWYENKYSFVPGTAPMNRWTHAALVCEPNGMWQQDGSVSNVICSLYFDGKKIGSKAVVFNGGDGMILALGTGYGVDAKSPSPVADTIFDEFQIYDAALGEAEVLYVAENTRPLEFAAGWEIMKDGEVELSTELPQRVWGVGTVTNDMVLHLAESVGGVFSGTIGGAGVAIENEEGVALTLSGSNAYAGVTHVVSGTLRVDTGLSAETPDFAGELVAYYPMDDVRHPCLDYSGNANDLLPAKDGLRSHVTYAAADSVAGGALTFPLDGTQTSADGYKSAMNTGLDGFTANTDNSFIVGGWVKIVEHHYREGLFGWGDYGVRLNNASNHNLLYFGDSGSLGQYTHPSSLADGTWHHIALVYDASPDDANDAFRLFFDGVRVARKVKNTSSDYKHGRETFYVGRAITSPGQNGSYFEGGLDELFVIKGADTNDVAKMYNHRRKEFVAANARTVLPQTTVLTVDAGARAEFTNAAECVSGLSGSGAVDIGAGSSLGVSGTIGFSGTVSGAGTLALGENLAWAVASDVVGDHAFFAVPEGYVLPDTSKWTTVPSLPNRTKDWSVKNGRVVLTLGKPGLVLFFW